MTNGESTGAEEIVWDLSDLYAGMDDPQLNADLDACDAEADALGAAYRGRVASLTAAELAALIARYEALYKRAGKVGSFASLNWTQDTQDAARGALMQRVTERGSRLSQKLVFLDLELAGTPDETAAAWLADPAVARWRHWLEVVRMYRPHLLSEPEEKILSEKAVTGRNAWDRFFDEVQGAAALRPRRREAHARPGAEPALRARPRAAPARRRVHHRRTQGSAAHQHLYLQHHPGRQGIG